MTTVGLFSHLFEYLRFLFFSCHEQVSHQLPLVCNYKKWGDGPHNSRAVEGTRVVSLCPPSLSQPGLSYVLLCPSPAEPSAPEARMNLKCQVEKRLLPWVLLYLKGPGRTKPDSVPCPLFRKLAEGSQTAAGGKAKPPREGKDFLKVTQLAGWDRAGT